MGLLDSGAMKALIPAILAICLLSACVSPQGSGRSGEVIIENQTDLTLRLVKVRYGKADIEFKNIPKGESRTWDNPNVRPPRTSVVQWASSKGTHFIRTIPVKAQLPMRHRTATRFVLHNEYVLILAGE